MKMIPWLAGVIGSYVGWWILARFGMMAGLLGSLVGMAIGGYYGAKWVRENLA
jgi:uncharacterized membrane protein YeaQ/YmgE (transglycosylase-associated protein family)